MHIGNLVTIDGQEHLCINEGTDGYGKEHLMLLAYEGDAYREPTVVQLSGPNGVMIEEEFEAVYTLGSMIQEFSDFLDICDEMDPCVLPSQAARAQSNLDSVRYVQWKKEHGMLDHSDPIGMLGPDCCDGTDAISLVGKIVMIEWPTEMSDEVSHEYVIVFQSDNSLYGISTGCAMSACLMRRLPLDTINIVNVRIDDAFVKFIVQNLETFADKKPGNYGDNFYEGAAISSWQLEYAIERRTAMNDNFTSEGDGHLYLHEDGCIRDSLMPQAVESYIDEDDFFDEDDFEDLCPACEPTTEAVKTDWSLSAGDLLSLLLGVRSA